MWKPGVSDYKVVLVFVILHYALSSIFLSTIDIINILSSAQFANSGKWCSMKTSSMPTPLDTAAVAWVDTWKFTDPQVVDTRVTCAICVNRVGDGIEIWRIKYLTRFPSIWCHSCTPYHFPLSKSCYVMS